MLTLLRELGIPPMMVGAMRHGMKGITEEQVKEMCARVGVGMFMIYAGGDVRASLHPDAITDDATLQRMVEVLGGADYTPDFPGAIDPASELALEP